eukprot:scaffold1803_cov92-Amphora_coffeaeformis.AAC.23
MQLWSPPSASSTKSSSPGEMSFWATLFGTPTKDTATTTTTTTTTSNIALLEACSQGDLAACQTLVHAHDARIAAAVDPQSGCTPLHLVTAHGHLELLEWLLAWTAFQANLPSSSGGEGTGDGSLVAIQEVPEEEDDPIDDDDEVAPFVAPSVLHLLQASDTAGNTPLHYASANGRVDMIRTIARVVGSSTNTRAVACAAWQDLLAQQNVHGLTPADWARHKHLAHVAKALENAMNRPGRSTTT